MLRISWLSILLIGACGSDAVNADIDAGSGDRVVHALKVICGSEDDCPSDQNCELVECSSSWDCTFRPGPYECFTYQMSPNGCTCGEETTSVSGCATDTFHHAAPGDHGVTHDEVGVCKPK